MTQRNAPAGWTVETLIARQAIHDCLQRYCWGIDRADLELVLSAFHPGARDNHSGIEESAEERFSRTVVTGAVMRTSHNLGNILIQIDGDSAACQSYFTAWHPFVHDGQTYDWVLAGRYVDRFECRDGDWGIAHRTVVYDLERFDGPGRKPEGHSTSGFLTHVVRGQKSDEDYSFAVLNRKTARGARPGRF